MKLKRVCAGVLAGVVVASAVVLPFEPVSVFAEAVPAEVEAFIETVQDWADNAEAIANLDANIDYYMPIGFVRAYIVNLEEAYAAETEFTISGSHTVAYYRLVSSGSVYASNIYLSNQDSSSICRSPHFNLTYSLSSVAGHTVSFSSSNYLYSVSADTTTIGAYCSLSARDTLGFFTSTYTGSGNTVSFSCYTYSDSIPVLSSRRISSSNLVGGFPSDLVFPSGSLSKASPWEYYNDVLIPFLQNEYPDTPVDLMPIPYEEPYEPIYPTDFVTGVPKDWTITNPQLPEIPDLDFQIPTADFDSLDVSPIRQNLSGVGFWWDLLETVLDTTAFKGLFLAFAIIGLAIFVLWKLGA